MAGSSGDTGCVTRAMCVVAKAIVVSVNHRLLPSRLENENLDRPCRGKAPAGPAPQDARYPQNRRLRLRLQHQPRAVRPPRYPGQRTRRTNELLYETLRVRQKTEILHSDFWLQGFGGG